MPTTRSGSRGETASSPASSVSSSKRKAENAPANKSAKRGRPSKEQKTIEQTIDAQPDDGDEKKQNGASDTNGNHQQDDHIEENVKSIGDAELAEKDVEMTSAIPVKSAEEGKQAESKPDETQREEKQAQSKSDDKEYNQKQANGDAEANAFDQVKAQEGEAGKTTKEEEKQDTAPAEKESAGNAIQDDKARAASLPSNILEKGIIYFFTRGRVGIDDPDSVQDLQRSFFVLRPLPDGAKIGDGSIPDSKTNRLFALPKKVWPKSGNDKFMVFVEKAKVDMKELKEEFFAGSEYSTKTNGTRQAPPVAPIGEGVYAITTTGGGQGNTHLVYMLTIPETPGDVQKDVGLSDKGSFVVSLKNPESSGPANAALPQKPDFPQEFMEEFRGRSWMPAHPKHLDYANAQMLLIGENFESSNNLEPKPKDEQDDKKVSPEEELTHLAEEDEHRVEALKGDDSVFVDLGISQKEYPKLMTTW